MVNQAIKYCTQRLSDDNQYWEEQLQFSANVKDMLQLHKNTSKHYLEDENNFNGYSVGLMQFELVNGFGVMIIWARVSAWAT